jgi:hypothetical protein
MGLVPNKRAGRIAAERSFQLGRVTWNRKVARVSDRDARMRSRWHIGTMMHRERCTEYPVNVARTGLEVMTPE